MNADTVRCAVAVVLVLFGVVLELKGLRDVGSIDWRYILIALAVAETGMFTWLRGWPWTW